METSVAAFCSRFGASSVRILGQVEILDDRKTRAIDFKLDIVLDWSIIIMNQLVMIGQRLSDVRPSPCTFRR